MKKLKELIRADIERLTPRNRTTYRRNHPKINRNDLCPCGSGKKYKHCCINK